MWHASVTFAAVQQRRQSCRPRLNGLSPTYTWTRVVSSRCRGRSRTPTHGYSRKRERERERERVGNTWTRVPRQGRHRQKERAHADAIRKGSLVAEYQEPVCTFENTLCKQKVKKGRWNKPHQILSSHVPSFYSFPTPSSSSSSSAAAASSACSCTPEPEHRGQPASGHRPSLCYTCTDGIYMYIRRYRCRCIHRNRATGFPRELKKEGMKEREREKEKRWKQCILEAIERTSTRGHEERKRDRSWFFFLRTLKRCFFDPTISKLPSETSCCTERIFKESFRGCTIAIIHFTIVRGCLGESWYFSIIYAGSKYNLRSKF